MKSVFLNAISILLAITALSQSNVRMSDAPPIASKDIRWKLNEYVWSHTHPELGKNDKPMIDFDAVDNWPVLSGMLSISPNGKYFQYGIENKVNWRLDSVIIQSTMNNWRVVLTPEARSGFFSSDSRHFIYQDKDGLCFLKNETNERRYEKGILDFKKDPKNEWIAYRLVNADTTFVLLNLLTWEKVQVKYVTSYSYDWTGKWLVYNLKDNQTLLRNLITGNETAFGVMTRYNFHPSGKWFVGSLDDSTSYLILHNLTNDRKIIYSDVKSYWLNDAGNFLILSTRKGLEYIDMIGGRGKLIWLMNDKDLNVNNVVLDEMGTQVVFITENIKKKETEKEAFIPLQTIWYWKVGMVEAEQKINTQMQGFDKCTIIEGAVTFTDNGRYIWFKVGLDKPVSAKPVPGAIQLDVWSYKDRVLHSEQFFQKGANDRSFMLNLETGQIIFHEREFEKLSSVVGDHGIIRKSGRDIYGDRFWEKGYYEDSVWLIDLKKGNRYGLPVMASNGYNPQTLNFSPDKLYLAYFDAIRGGNYFSYELATGKEINISAGIPSWQLGITDPFIRTKANPVGGSGIIKRLNARNAFLVQDKYGDVWQLDFRGTKPPLCITNGYGKVNNISFHLLNSLNSESDTLFFAAYNRKTKMQGFYKKVLGAKVEPELLSMNAWAMGISRYEVSRIIKAQEANTWIVKCESATMAPNYFVTHDLKEFTQLTWLEPHKKYNWLTAELHSFKQLDGTLSQGVLYKPENFNPGKKYPLVISFYGNLSDQLYQYPAANYINCPAIFEEPAWMVSHGYLVFMPDIYFTKNQWGPSTVNTVEGAAHYLGKLPYVDSNHMGAVGHSNSGRFGYYLLTHSKSFAAMSVGAGTTNILNLSLSLDRKQKSMLRWGEVESYGSGLGNIWKRKESWIDQISVMHANNVASPLLLFHNKKDGAPVEQALQMFIALRRLDKKVWWLQYDNGNHVVGGDDARDWTIRYTQFFDHYLKGAPAPRWMTRGIAADSKGIETGYELDPEGSCSMKNKSRCNVCDR